MSYVCVDAGKYPCSWPKCNEKFDRLENRKAHVSKVHQHADERKLRPRRVARNESFFLYACKKGLRGKGGHVHVGISCPPDEVVSSDHLA